ncbi:hypothetical protein [Epilithonimonas vandammei]|uniref:hypothetical protein n=1 Tax=Epilithonimonas vandammei TaxID=2487072 RepID=UPI0028A8802D|nr:hypothetical protein [Epilithonimonas vandammei]
MVLKLFENALNFKHFLQKTYQVNLYKYIGETSGYCFVLNSKNNDVLVINKAGIHIANVETNKFRETEQKQAQKHVDVFFNKVNDFLNSNKR